MDSLLLKLLGSSFDEGEVLQRQSLGNIVHIFSHIRMTLLVERLVLQVGPDCTVHKGLEELPVMWYLTAAFIMMSKQHLPCNWVSEVDRLSNKRSCVACTLLFSKLGHCRWTTCQRSACQTRMQGFLALDGCQQSNCKRKGSAAVSVRSQSLLAKAVRLGSRASSASLQQSLPRWQHDSGSLDSIVFALDIELLLT